MSALLVSPSLSVPKRLSTHFIPTATLWGWYRHPPFQKGKLMPGGVQVPCLKSHSKVSGEGGLEPRKFHARGESTLGAQMLPTCCMTFYSDPKSRANLFCALQGKLESRDTRNNVKMIPCGQCWEEDTRGTWSVNYGWIWPGGRNQGKFPWAGNDWAQHRQWPWGGRGHVFQRPWKGPL